MEWKTQIYYHIVGLEHGLNDLESQGWTVECIFHQPVEEDRSYFFVVVKREKKAQ